MIHNNKPLKYHNPEPSSKTLKQQQHPANTPTKQHTTITEGSEMMKMLMQSEAQITSYLSLIYLHVQNQQSTLMLSHQVNELQNHNREKDEQIREMERKINKLEQKAIEKT